MHTPTIAPFDAANVHGLAELQREHGVHRNIRLPVLHAGVQHVGRGEVGLRRGGEVRRRCSDATSLPRW